MTSAQPTATYHKKPYQAIDPKRPELSQKGRTVLITGGATGIGFAVSRAFVAASAARVIILGRRTSMLEDAIVKLQRLPGADATTLLTKCCDVADLDATAKLWADLAEEEIVVDTLVVNAATIGSAGSVLERGTVDVWRDFTMNVRAVMDFTERFYKQDRKGAFDKKYLVNVSSSAIHQWDGRAKGLQSYGLTKNAGTLFMQQVARAVPVREMQVISFHPGSILSEAARKAGFNETSGIPWEDENLPGHYAVWAASPEAEKLHGRFVWAHWDVDELLSGASLKRIEDEDGYLKIGVIGLAT